MTLTFINKAFFSVDRMAKGDRLVRNQAFIDDVKDDWVTIFNFLSYSGNKKNTIYQRFNEKFGEEHWLPAHFFDEKVVSRYDAYLIYEEGYYQFLKKNPDIRKWIVQTASEVFDIATSNVASGLDYCVQECDATHLQDITVRRALTRLQLEDEGISYDPENLPVIPIFEGDHLVQIRGHETEGYVLTPGQVPFHRPELGVDEPKRSCWKKDSVEDIYQRNKVLIVNPEVLQFRLAMLTPDKAFFADTKKDYFLFDPEKPNALFYEKGRDVRRAAHNGSLPHYCEIIAAPKEYFSRLTALVRASRPRSNDVKKLSFSDFLGGMENAPA